MKTFKKGDRVKLNKEWGEWDGLGGMNTGYPVGRKGSIACIHEYVVGVRFDGNKTSTFFHTSFLNKIRKVVR